MPRFRRKDMIVEAYRIVDRKTFKSTSNGEMTLILGAWLVFAADNDKPFQLDDAMFRIEFEPMDDEARAELARSVKGV